MYNTHNTHAPDPTPHARQTHTHSSPPKVAAALQRVLLDGGPARVFVPADVELVGADVASVKQLFNADGDGVDWQVGGWMGVGCRLCGGNQGVSSGGSWVCFGPRLNLLSTKPDQPV
jgi:hypothetical protein